MMIKNNIGNKNKMNIRRRIRILIIKIGEMIIIIDSCKINSCKIEINNMILDFLNKIVKINIKMIIYLLVKIIY